MATPRFKRTDKTVDELFRMIDRQYPNYPCTFGNCMNGCGGMGRGSRECADCLTKELGKLIDDEGLAFDYLELVERAHKMRHEIMGKIEIKKTGLEGVLR